MLFVYEFLINHVYKYLWIKYEQHILICIFISKKIHINILIINSIITNILITLIYLYILSYSYLNQESSVELYLIIKQIL